MSIKEKETVIRWMLGRTLTVVSPSTAQVATLGGEGLEAAVWKELGIAPENGWLIDMSPRAIKRLARVHGETGYQLSQKHFGRFAKQHAETRGLDTGLDFLHVDLCGTVERVIAELPTAIGLVAKSRARMLALTTSDKRRHPATDEPNGVRKLVKTIFDEPAAKQLIVSVHESHAAYEDVCASGRRADLSTWRELSSVLCLFLSQILDSEGGLAPSQRYQTLQRLWLQASSRKTEIYAPDSMERAIFPSRGFSMRSYLFRLSSQKVDLLSAVHKLHDLWLKAPSFCYDKGSQALISIQSKPKTKRTKTLSTQMEASVSEQVADDLKSVIERLRAATGFLNPSLVQDIDTLIQRASAPPFDLEHIVRQLHSEATNKLGEVFSSFLIGQPKNGSAKARPAKQTDSKNNGASRDLEALGMEQKDDLRLCLLTAKLEGQEALEKAMGELIKEFGMARKKNRRQVVASLLAHTQGKFRANFMARMLQRNPAKISDMAEQLGRLYEIKASDVIAVAKSSRTWQP